MGKGYHLWIINNSGHPLKLGHYHGNFMKSWNFTDIDVDAQVPFYLEFLDKLVQPGDISGIAEFLLGETCSKFQLRAIWNHKGSYDVHVDWSSLDVDKYVPFPYPKSDRIASLGGSNSAHPCLIVQEFVFSSPCRIPVSGEIEWMACYGDIIGSLSLREMTLPGSHNAGTYKPTSSWIIKHYVRCQNLSLIDQLNLGVRVLDLRVAQCGARDFILSHDTYRTSYSLREALLEVIRFIDQTSKEIVILDFHRFNNISSINFNFSELKEQIKEQLSGYDLPVVDGGMDLSLHDLWSGHAFGKRRVIIAWNSNETIEPYMWPGVYHEWYSQANSETKLHSSLDRTISGIPPLREGLWNVCVFRTTSSTRDPYKNAKNLHPMIDSWFHGCAEWTLKANIISTDFCGEFNNIIQASICANILKGAKIFLKPHPR